MKNIYQRILAEVEYQNLLDICLSKGLYIEYPEDEEIESVSDTELNVRIVDLSSLLEYSPPNHL